MTTSTIAEQRRAIFPILRNLVEDLINEEIKKARAKLKHRIASRDDYARGVGLSGRRRIGAWKTSVVNYQRKLDELLQRREEWWEFVKAGEFALVEKTKPEKKSGGEFVLPPWGPGDDDRLYGPGTDMPRTLPTKRRQ